MGISLRVVIGVLVLAVASACTPGGGEAAGPGGEEAAGPGGGEAARSPGAAGELPAGWRWESYGGVEVGVPGDWGWGISTQALTQWCIAEAAHKPLVGRPGAATQVGCSTDDPEPPADTLVANTGPVVGFDRTTEADGTAHEGDRTTVRLRSVQVVVQVPADLRRRIVDTIRRSEVDSNGCPATHVISGKPQWRPGIAAEAGSLPAVSGVSVCKYQVGASPAGTQPRLLSSARLEGATAAEAIRGVAQAPVGGGPNSPATCSEEVSYGDEVMVLRIRSAAAPAQLVVRYSGCDHNGFDDGVTVRRLTATAMAPFLTGPNRVHEFLGGSEMATIMGW
jgi:hypothetical protein